MNWTVNERFTSAESLVVRLDPTASEWGAKPDRWAFRGQKDSRWDLVPGAWRPNALDQFPGPDWAAPINTRREQIEAEWRAIAAFHEFAHHAGMPLPEEVRALTSQSAYNRELTVSLEHAIGGVSNRDTWPMSRLFSLAALAQHHGVPTCLLDWSWSPYVAAYFAAKDAATSLGPTGGARGVRRSRRLIAIWAVNAWSVHQSLRKYKGGINELRFELVTPASAWNPNLRAQRGLLIVDRGVRTWPDLPYTTPFNVAVVEAAEAMFPGGAGTAYGAPPVLRRLTLPWTEAPKLLRLLSHHGFTAATLFPGYDGVVEAIRERRLWDDPTAQEWDR